MSNFEVKGESGDWRIGGKMRVLWLTGPVKCSRIKKDNREALGLQRQAKKGFLRNERLMAALVRKEGRKMIGEARKNLKMLVCTGIVILFMTESTKATLITPVDSNSIVRDGIEYYIQTDKSVYELGENVEILYRVTNLTDNPVSIGEKSLFSPDYDVIITDDGDAKVWQYILTLPPPPTPPETTVFHLEPYETKEYQTIWDLTNDNGTSERTDDFPVDPGIYKITGELYLYFWEEIVPVSESVEIIPEPATILLFGLGGLVLIRKRRAG